MYEIITTALTATGLPFAYSHFAEGESPQPPFVCWRVVRSDNFQADGINYLNVEEIDIELYTDKKDPTTEGLLRTALTNVALPYEISEVYIPSEKLYQVIFKVVI